MFLSLCLGRLRTAGQVPVVGELKVDEQEIDLSPTTNRFSQLITGPAFTTGVKASKESIHSARAHYQQRCCNRP